MKNRATKILAGRRRWTTTLATSLTAIALALLVVASTRAGGCFLAGTLEDRAEVVTASGLALAQAIVVLGSRPDLKSIDYNRPDSPTLTDLSILRYAGRLYRKTSLPILVTAPGEKGKHIPDESLAMAYSLSNDFHIPVTWRTQDSGNLTEIAQASAKILRTAGLRQILLVTDAIHMSRAKSAFDRSGLNAIPAPTHFYSTAPRIATDFLPSSDGIHISHAAIKEWGLAILNGLPTIRFFDVTGSN